MLTSLDFSKKQIVFVMFSEGEKMSFSNDNLVVKTSDGKIKFQCTCYRLFLVFAVGNTSITSAVIQKAKKFGFFIAFCTIGFRVYSVIGGEKEGNTLLRKKQYSYSKIDIAKVIVENKMENQQQVLKNVRHKNESIKEAIDLISEYIRKATLVNDINELLAYEGLASKTYFKNHFDNVPWQGRQPRIKRDYVNSALDVGYTLLFSFVEAIAESHGFDPYCGVLHKQFYMRKSLICDLIEPFRVLIDCAVKKSINLKQITEKDFIVVQGQWRLKWESSPKCVRAIMEEILEYKENIFIYVQNYYRAFMKDKPPEQYPKFILGEK